MEGWIVPGMLHACMELSQWNPLKSEIKKFLECYKNLKVIKNIKRRE
jgi:hypothetical protein